MHALLNSPCKKYALLIFPCKMHALLNLPREMHAHLISPCKMHAFKFPENRFKNVLSSLLQVLKTLKRQGEK